MDNIKNTKKKSDNNNSINLNIISKIFSPIKILLKLHLKVAKEELKKDFSRYMAGLFFAIIGLISLLMFGILFNFIITLLFKNFVFKYLNTDYSFLMSIICTAGINLFFVIMGFIIAGSNFKKPPLQETKKVIEETLKEFK